MNRPYKIMERWGHDSGNKEKTGTEVCLCGKCTCSIFGSDRETARRIFSGRGDTKLVLDHGRFEDRSYMSLNLMEQI